MHGCTHAEWLKPPATGCEARLRGLTKPASAGLVNVAEGFSPTACDVDEPYRPSLALDKPVETLTCELWPKLKFVWAFPFQAVQGVLMCLI